MKDQAIQFLGNLPQSEGDQFNKALELYRKSKNHDPGKLRYYNQLGYNKDRLESLLYEVKKMHSISDVEVAQATKVVKLKVVRKKKVGKKKVAAKNLEVIDPVVVGSDADEDKVSKKDTDVPKIDTPVVKNATSDTIDTTKEEVDSVIDAANADREKFLKEDLANFDTEAEKYNSIKSFAAILSDYINEDPADQKGDTLKAFIEAAKKNFVQS